MYSVFSVGRVSLANRPQYGHSKSENTIMTTGAFALPKRTASSSATGATGTGISRADVGAGASRQKTDQTTATAATIRINDDATSRTLEILLAFDSSCMEPPAHFICT